MSPSNAIKTVFSGARNTAGNVFALCEAYLNLRSGILYGPWRVPVVISGSTE